MAGRAAVLPMNLAVIVPSRSSENLFPCVAAVQKHEPTARIIVVDDGLATIPEGVEVVPGISPFVYGRNINIGIRFANGADGVVLLNDDAILQTPGGFTTMAQACVDYQEFGLIGAVADMHIGNPNQHRGAIGLRSERRMLCFVCVYIPRTTIESVGLLDERYVKYGLDDDDYSFRVRDAGLKLGVHDDCVVDHGALKSSYRSEGGPGADFKHNMRLFIEKWGHDNHGHSRYTSEFAELFP